MPHGTTQGRRRAVCSAAAGCLRVAAGQSRGWAGIPWILVATVLLLVVRPEISPLPVVACTAAAFFSSKTRGLRVVIAAVLIACILAMPSIFKSELDLDATSMDSIDVAASER